MNAAFRAPSGASTSTVSRPAVNSRQVLSTRLARLSGETIAQIIGKDITTASRVATGERGCTMDQWLALLEKVELKLVDQGKLCVSTEQFEFMRQTTARAIANADIARTLFEDPE